MALPHGETARAACGGQDCFPFSFMFSDKENVSGAGGQKRILVG
jgi:hypothetical protein